MANEELEQVEEHVESDTAEPVLEATDDEDTEELVEFQASGEASSVPDPINVGSSRRKADKNNGMPMEKLGKTGVIAKVVDAFSSMSMGQASKAYKGLMDSSGNKSSIKAKGNAKAPVKLHMMANVKVKEDMEALFADKDNLTEDFFDQATTIFEAALNIKATIVEEALREHYAAELAEAKAHYEEELEKRLDEYLEYVADTWLEENEIAIESALKVEMAENFMDGIKTLFTESNVTIPEEKVDQFDEMEKKVEELTTSLDEAVNDTIALTGVIKDQNGQILFNEKSKELTLKQRDEFTDLVEGLDFEDLDDYDSKLDTILETYFNKKPATTDIVESIAVDIESEDKPTGISEGPMAAYAQAITRTLNK
jgi:hypothetical protein